jgi:uncharacterized protein
LKIATHLADDRLATVDEDPKPEGAASAGIPSSKDLLLWRATWFQGGLLVAAIAGAWLSSCDLWSSLAVNSTCLTIGVIATLPLAGIVFGLSLLRLAPLKRIERLVQELIGPAVAECTWPQLAWLALLAGVSEEVLFRGWLWQMAVPWGFQPALIGTSIAFGLAHPITRSYFVLATLIGVYLASVAYAVPGANLWSAIVVHTLYDLIGLKLIAAAASQELAGDRLEGIA